jgi:hypothetical protein
MTNQHPITPSPELVKQWWDDFNGTFSEFEAFNGAFYEFEAITAKVFQAGADQELEACCEWLSDPANTGIDIHGTTAVLYDLRAARRPKPPSLKELALHALGSPTKIGESRVIEHRDHDLLRRALEALPDD